MDDEMILARGGTEADIRAYAEANGADNAYDSYAKNNTLRKFLIGWGAMRLLKIFENAQKVNKLPLTQFE